MWEVVHTKAAAVPLDKKGIVAAAGVPGAVAAGNTASVLRGTQLAVQQGRVLQVGQTLSRQTQHDHLRDPLFPLTTASTSARDLRPLNPLHVAPL
jgi:hypothetical protein